MLRWACLSDATSDFAFASDLNFPQIALIAMIV